MIRSWCPQWLEEKRVVLHEPLGCKSPATVAFEDGDDNWHVGAADGQGESDSHGGYFVNRLCQHFESSFAHTGLDTKN